MATPTIELHGFQSGPTGFVQYGLGLNDTEPIDYLFIRALCGRQGGKTFAGASRSALYMGTYANSSGMIVSLTSDKLRDTVLPTLYTIYRMMGLQHGTDYTYNKTERCITFTANNSLCYLRSAEEPDNLPGPSLSWFWLDEFRMMQERVFLLLQPTLTKPGFPHQCWLTSTPAGKGHWSRKIWLPKAYALDYNTKPIDHKAGTYISFKGRTQDNPHLAPAYYQTLVDTYGEGTQLFRQEMLGEEVVMEGLVYDCFSPEKHLVPASAWKHKPTITLAGVDFGFRSPTAIIVGGVDQEGRHYLIDEFYRKGMDEKSLALEAKRLMQRYNIRFFMCDYEDPRWIKSLRTAGLPAIPAKKVIGSRTDPSSGIGLCYSLLNGTMPDGSPRIYIDPKLVNFRREIDNYALEEEKMGRNPSEMPIRLNNHAMDAWRYLEAALSYYFLDTTSFGQTKTSVRYTA